MRDGYILLHRQGLTIDEWKNPRRTLAWIDLLTLVNYEDCIVTASYGFLAYRWRVSKNTVHLWIRHWTAERQIERQTERDTERNAERFFVVNYAKYQKSAERVTERTTERVTERTTEQKKEVSSIKSIESNTENTPKPPKGDLIAFIEFFKKVTRRPHLKITASPDRQKAFDARLKEFTKQEIAQAVEAMADDDFLTGDNKNSKNYLTIDYALRPKSIEKYLNHSQEIIS